MAGGFAKSTVAKQLKADDVDPRFIVGISRERDLQPLNELSKFSGYEILRNRPTTPSVEECLTLVGLPDLLVQVTKRFHWKFQKVTSYEYPIAVQTWQPWFKLVAPQATLATCQDVLGLSAAAVSRNHSRANWNIAQVLTMAEAFNFSPQMALVACGILTPYEAGFAYTLREDAVEAATDEQLQVQVIQLAPRIAEMLNHQEEYLYRSGSIGDLAQ